VPDQASNAGWRDCNETGILICQFLRSLEIRGG
jgi:hypothetical protein